MRVCAALRFARFAQYDPRKGPVFRLAWRIFRIRNDPDNPRTPSWCACSRCFARGLPQDL